MGVSGGPNIVDNGLVLTLDVANDKSFRGEPTTNILSTYVNPTFENGTKTSDGWAFDAKLNGTYDYYTLDRFSGNFCVRLQNATDSAIAFWRQSIPVTSGLKYTMSVYAKNINCPTTPYFSGVNISLDAGQNASFTGIDNSTWKRFTATFTATATGNAEFYIRTNQNASQGYFLIDNFQIEQKAYATPFVNGTRGTTVATGGGLANLVTNANHGELVNGPVYNSANGGSILFDGVDDYVVVSSPGSYSNYTFDFYCRWVSNTQNSNRVFGLSNFGTYTIFNQSDVAFHYNPIGGSPPSTTISSGVNVGFGNWCHIALTVSATATVVTLYVNGMSRNTTNILPAQNFAGNVYLGAQNTITTVSANCQIAKFSLYNRALTSEEIQQNFDATRSRFGI